MTNAEKYTMRMYYLMCVNFYARKCAKAAAKAAEAAAKAAEAAKPKLISAKDIKNDYRYEKYITYKCSIAQREYDYTYNRQAADKRFAEQYVRKYR